MLKAVKIRVYPNKSQANYINKLLGCYRLIYNKCLDRKKTAYLTDKTSLGLKELGSYFHQDLTKLEEFNFLKEHNTKVLKQSIINLTEAYKRFFVNGNGFPKFKSKHDSNQSARFPEEAISSKNDYLTSKLTLTSQLKNIKFECSEKDKKYLQKYKDKIKSATISRTKSDNYYLSILVDGYIEKELPKPINNIIGIDIGIKDFMVCSDSQIFDNLKIKRNNEKTLIKLQRQLSNKVIGSHNRYKAKVKLARKHEKINNIKINYIHNITTQLVRENQTIVIEDLNVKGMMKNHNLAKSIQELSIHETFRQLKYKCEWYGRDLIVVDRWFPSSKLCSVCDYKYKNLSLNERVWLCPVCGTKHDRDYNAATNIENEGKRILNLKLGQRLPEVTLVDCPLMDDKAEMPLKSNDRSKQEESNLTRL